MEFCTREETAVKRFSERSPQKVSRDNVFGIPELGHRPSRLFDLLVRDGVEQRAGRERRKYIQSRLPLEVSAEKFSKHCLTGRPIG